MENGAFPGCCGIEVVWNFREDSKVHGLTSAERDNGDGIPAGLVLIALTQKQKRARKLVLSCGYMAIARFVSRDTGNTVTLFSKVHPTKRLPTRRGV